MCDTMVALGNSTMDGSVIFAKNSDRQPNEPHIMIRLPGKKHHKGEKVKCTYIEIDQVPETYEVLLLKPSWIWGCEMGCNQFGLNIGNEAVFTKEKYGENSLIGMDMVRLALERCKTSEDALNLMVDLLERYSQGGNCGYQKSFTYHNSFLIADRYSAWVLETAGEYWAAEKVKDVRSISNCLTIETSFDRCHPGLIQHAIDRGWCKGEKDFNFAKCYSDPLYTKFSGSIHRHSVSSTVLQKQKGRITMDTMKKILRTHEDKIEGSQFEKHSLKSICMHGGFVIGDHTTGSYIASLKANICTYLVTGSSTPCISVFKPLWLIEGERFSFPEDREDSAVVYWRKREKLHRLVLEGRIPSLDLYIAERDNLERTIGEMIDSIDPDNPDEKELLNIMESAMEKEETLIERTIRSSLNSSPKFKGGLYFRHYWSRQNKKLGIR